MLSKYSYKDLTWIDLESPTEEELIHVMEMYDIPIIVGQEIHEKSSRSKVDLYENFIYAILHFPQIVENSKILNTRREIDVIIGNDFIVTIHYGNNNALQEFSNFFESHAVIEKRMDMDNAGFLFLYLIKEMHTHSQRQLKDIETLLKETERKILNTNEKSIVPSLSGINKTLLDFKQELRAHRDILDSFELPAKKFFGEKFGYSLSEIIGEHAKAQILLDEHRETLNDLRNTNNTLRMTQTTQATKALAVMGIIILPIMILSVIFMLDARFNVMYPSGLVLLVSIISFLYFKFKKWL